jgi:hypothetical protein
MSTKIQTKKESNVIPFDVTTMEDDAGMGLQNVTTDDLALPFLKISDGKGDIGSGDIFNNVTGEVFDGTEGIKVVPCVYQKRYIEWAPMGEQGYPVNIFTPEDMAAGRVPKTEQREEKDRTDWVVGSSNYIENTAQHYVVRITDEGGMEPGLISMKRTGLKRSKAWNSMMQSRVELGKNGPFQPPAFAYVYTLKTERQQRDNNIWYLWKVTLEGNLGENAKEPGIVYNFSKSFASSIDAGEVVVKHEGDSPSNTDDIAAKGDDSPF